MEQWNNGAMFRRYDPLFLGLTIGLTLFGLAMIASVSVFESYQISSRLVRQGVLAEPTNAVLPLREFLGAPPGGRRP